MVRLAKVKETLDESRMEPVTAFVPSRASTTLPLESRSTAVAKNCASEPQFFLVSLETTSGYRHWFVWTRLGGQDVMTAQDMFAGVVQESEDSDRKRRCKSSVL